MYEKKLEKNYQCPLEYVLEVFGTKWSSRVYCLIVKEGPIRYGDFHNHLEGISDPVLSGTLKSLIRHGIIERKSYDEMPIRVEYCITEKGISAIPVLEGLCQWTALYGQEKNHKILVQCEDCKFWE